MHASDRRPEHELSLVRAELERCVIDARAAEAEYRRALDDFQRLMSHRIANPLQVIIGMVDTLLLMPDLDPARRISFLGAVSDQARVLREVCADPRVVGPVEAALRPTADPLVVRRFDRSSSRIESTDVNAHASFSRD